jgi:nucleotide-binding universal stress UspA family protein
MDQPILCGTDFSPVATEAAGVAAALARRFETTLVLVHIEEFYGMAAVDPALFEAALARRRGMMDLEGARLRDLGTTVETKVLSGSVFDELVAAGVEMNAHTVVVGAIGHGLSRRLLVGSVAERTAETSTVPTLVVRPDSAFLSWLGEERSLKILIGYDFSAASEAALGWAKNLQQIGRCEISVVHIAESPDKASPSLERELSGRIAKSGLAGEITALVESSWGNPEGALFETAQNKQADLMVVGTQQRHGLSRVRFGSVSRAVLRHANVSVAVVPPADAHPDKAGIDVFIDQ